ncbi:MAG: UDP-N-acetylmuramoyl-tripeptide--D-alanyl-D-alanine ligase, partial [Bdellovibrionota bacterium]
EPSFLHRLRRLRNIALVAVDDPQAALGRAGAYRRSLLPDLQVVGLTGSNGKTTTKEILAAILESAGSTLATRGNLNNHLGVPITLLSLEPTHRYAVIEMGASGPGEIDKLAAMARPHVGIITIIAPAHLEGFGSLEGVRRAKGEIVRHIAVSGTFVVNADDPSCVEIAKGFSGNLLRFSTHDSKNADVWAKDIQAAGPDGMSFVLYAGKDSRLVRLPMLGEHNVSNALAAACAALALRLSLDQIVSALERVRPAEMRSELHVGSDGTVLLLDCYNANPLSMSRALETLSKMQGVGRKIAILGQMNELGGAAESFHTALGEEAARQGIDWLLYTGAYSEEVVEAAKQAGLKRAESFPSHAEILSALARDLKPGDRILVKGSRGAQMEKVALPLLRKIERKPQEGREEAR